MKWLCNSKKKTYHFHPILCPTPQKNTNNPSMFYLVPTPQKKSDAWKLPVSPMKNGSTRRWGKKQPIHHGHHRRLLRSFSQVATPTGLGKHLAEGAAVEMIGWCRVILFRQKGRKSQRFCFRFEKYLGIEHRWNTSFLNIQVFPVSSCSSGFASTSRISNSMYCISIKIYKDMSCTKDFLRGLLSYYIKRALKNFTCNGVSKYMFLAFYCICFSHSRGIT